MLVDNVPLRAALERGAPAEEVVRLLDQGDLLFDITGSSITMSGDTMLAGSRISIREGEADDGSRILLAFTRQQEVLRLHADAPDSVQTLGQSAAGALEFARTQGYAWLHLDPASPASALLPVR